MIYNIAEVFIPEVSKFGIFSLRVGFESRLFHNRYSHLNIERGKVEKILNIKID
jgi:hypothetical protein